MPSGRFLNVVVLSMLTLSLGQGCGSNQTDRGPVGVVSGKVTFKGEAVTEGTVHFTNATSGFGGTAAIESDGHYRLSSSEGLPVGQYSVTVMPPVVMESIIPNSPPSEVPKEMPNIPEKYRFEGSSGLNVDVTAGKVTFDIDMNDAPQ